MYVEVVNLTVLLTSEPLSLDAAFRAVLDPACGGTALFVGTTRSPNQGREVDQLQYEAYAELAEPDMERVARKAAATHGLGAVYVAHRVGVVGAASGGTCGSWATHRGPSVVPASSRRNRSAVGAGTGATTSGYGREPGCSTR